MKRIPIFILGLTLAFALAACGSTAGQETTNPSSSVDENSPAISTPETLPSNQPEDTAPPEEETPAETEDSGRKILIAYFSATNTTEGIANHIQTALDDEADVYEILPETPYTSADLNYNTDCRANQEQNDDTARPAISGSVANMEDYDVIFLGYPIWWGQAPKIMYTFLESYDLSGKTIVPFCTSGSSGIGSSATNLKGSAGSSTWLSGQRFGGSASFSTVETWVKGLGLEF
ncbi:MAG: NAD(P)H-dependent oxidoreductase [Oscillospiraceae bacterium]|nr:NAD(P)H-dependent oxidoreductase [Oscillospiraceae bacterium]